MGRSIAVLLFVVGVAAPAGARAVPLLRLFFPSDPGALAAGGIPSAQDPTGELLRLEHPALLAEVKDGAAVVLERQDILHISAPARLAGTQIDDLSLGATVMAGARVSDVPAGMGVRLAGHRAQLAASGPPLGRVMDLDESGEVASIAVGARLLPWLWAGGGVDRTGDAFDARYELRVAHRGWLAGYAHRVDRVPAELAAPSGISAARPTPPLQSSVDLGAASDLVYGGYESAIAGASGAYDVSRPGTWFGQVRMRPLPRLTLHVDRQGVGFRTAPVASAGQTAVADLDVNTHVDRWTLGADLDSARNRWTFFYSEAVIDIGAMGHDYGRQSARALLGADVDLALFVEQHASAAVQQVGFGYHREANRLFGFAVGAQALRLRAGPGVVRYGSRLTDALSSQDSMELATVDALALTGGVTLQVGGVRVQAGAAQLVPFRVSSGTGGAQGGGGSEGGGGGGGGDPFSRLRAVLAQYGGGNMEVVQVSGRF